MKSSLFISTALAVVLAASAVYAQSATGTGTGTSTSTSNSGSTSGAQGVVGPQGNSVVGGGQSQSNSNSGAASNSNASTRAQSSGNASNQNINFNSPGNTTSNNTNNTRSNENVNYSGGTNNYSRQDGDLTVRTTPTVYAPPVSGGNPCTLAVSGGVSVIGWGAAAGGTFVDQDCANRQKIAMIHNAGYAGAAKELMCNDKDAYFAFRSAGQPCLFRAAFEGQPGTPPLPTQPPMQTQPMPVTQIPSGPAMQPAPVATQRTLPRCSRTVTDNCYSG